ncbi:hypothetical protein GUJ93_ZPchr0006g46191 [Zizania palustris]|uniref:Uncharacterized protein n=1 Tax=Zizania palustris TaxID=103762 RepID=A0A8J5T2U9_ZIZPA|nr:hypothetical protein GUJ93_ZPchr0006g46191 [Zizania palustris]
MAVLDPAVAEGGRPPMAMASSPQGGGAPGNGEEEAADVMKVKTGLAGGGSLAMEAAAERDKPCSMSMGSSDDMKELIEKLAAKIDDLKTSLDKLAPLAPVADHLATLTSKVVALQSSTFKKQEQVRALNLVLLCVENT